MRHIEHISKYPVKWDGGYGKNTKTQPYRRPDIYRLIIQAL